MVTDRTLPDIVTESVVVLFVFVVFLAAFDHDCWLAAFDKGVCIKHVILKKRSSKRSASRQLRASQL